MAAQKTSSDAILAAERLCREVFASAGAVSHGLSPALYYLAGTGQCLRTEVLPDGSAEGGFGLCAREARFERNASGRMLFTCVLPSMGEPPAVYRVTESGEQLSLRSVRAPPTGMPAAWTVWRTLAACSLAVTDEDRHLAGQLVERAAVPEWLDAPLAAWESPPVRGASQENHPRRETADPYGVRQ
jgi:hypothetical protein